MVKLSESCVHTHLLTFLPLLIEVKMESDTSLFSEMCSIQLLVFEIRISITFEYFVICI